MKNYMPAIIGFRETLNHLQSDYKTYLNGNDYLENKKKVMDFSLFIQENLLSQLPPRATKLIMHTLQVAHYETTPDTLAFDLTVELAKHKKLTLRGHLQTLFKLWYSACVDIDLQKDFGGLKVDHFSILVNTNKPSRNESAVGSVFIEPLMDDVTRPILSRPIYPNAHRLNPSFHFSSNEPASIDPKKTIDSIPDQFMVYYYRYSVAPASLQRQFYRNGKNDSGTGMNWLSEIFSKLLHGFVLGKMSLEIRIRDTIDFGNVVSKEVLEFNRIFKGLFYLDTHSKPGYYVYRIDESAKL